MVERIMALDKNQDGKITADELPERLQHLLALGDTNRDGALDRDEVRKLVTAIESFVDFTAPGGPGGPGKGGPKGPPKGPPGANAQRALDDLEISGKTREKAEEIVKSHRDKLRRMEDVARADLLIQMKEVLSEKEFNEYKISLGNQPGGPPKKGPPKGPDLQRSLDRLQKDLDEIRGKLPK
jgi:hypothetical protein